MISAKKIVEVSPNLFVNSLPAGIHSKVQAMFHDDDIDYAVLMIENDGNERSVVPVGKRSAHKRLSDIFDKPIKGMQAKAFVNARGKFPDLSKVLTPKKRNVKLEPKDQTKVNYSNGQISTLQNEIRELKHKLAEEQSKVLLRDQTITEMRRHIEQGSFSTETDTYNDSVLIDRESSVQKAEEELINRLTYLMEKEAELEQFEENLSHRSQILDERENKLLEPT